MLSVSINKYVAVGRSLPNIAKIYNFNKHWWRWSISENININIRNFYKNLEVKHHIFMDTCKFHYNSPRFRAAIKKWYRLKISSELTSYIFFCQAIFIHFMQIYIYSISRSFHFIFLCVRYTHWKCLSSVNCEWD